jgi:hypothetical protein
MKADVVARLKHAFRLFCIAGTASERGVAMPYEERRLSFVDQVALRTIPHERHATSIDYERGSATPSRVSAMRRTSPIDSVTWHDEDLDPADAWRTAATNLLGALGHHVDPADTRHAAMARLPSGRAAPVDPLDPATLADLVQGMMPAGRDWGIELPSWRSPGHLLRLNPHTCLAMRAGPLPPAIDSRLAPSIHPLDDVTAPLRRHVVWGRPLGAVETLRALRWIDPETATAIEGMRP